MNLTGAAGEHYVMCQLLRRDFIAALAPVGVPNTDIVVTDAVGDRLASIQVKSRRDIGSDGGWHVRQIPAWRAVKDYTCPGCGQVIRQGQAHLVAWRADWIMGDEDAGADRRHWHPVCWRTRPSR